MAVTSNLRRYQFSLKTLLIVMFLASLGLGWLGHKAAQVRYKRAAVLALQNAGGTVKFDQEWREDSPEPAWLRKLTGNDFTGDELYVAFNETMVAESSLVHVAAMPELREVFLVEAPVTDRGLVYLQGLKRLETLQLTHTRTSDEGLANLAGMTNLKYLRLGGTRVTDAGLIHLQALKQLKGLALDDTQVSDAGLRIIKDFADLKSLSLDRTLVTDVGLKHLGGLSNLRDLSLYKTKTTKAGVAKLQEALPKLVVNGSPAHLSIQP